MCFKASHLTPLFCGDILDVSGTENDRDRPISGPNPQLMCRS
jgi:hypothetical protein